MMTQILSEVPEEEYGISCPRYTLHYKQILTKMQMDKGPMEMTDTINTGCLNTSMLKDFISDSFKVSSVRVHLSDQKTNPKEVKGIKTSSHVTQPQC